MIDNITLDNLHIGCKASNKAEVIAMIGAECKARICESGVRSLSAGA